jgi:hypothetical protein
MAKPNSKKPLGLGGGIKAGAELLRGDAFPATAAAPDGNREDDWHLLDAERPSSHSHAERQCH